MYTMLRYLHHFLTNSLPASLSSRISALLFVLRLAIDLPIFPALNVQNVVLTAQHHQADMYTSSQTSQFSRNTRTILIVHGLAASGKDDPRIVRLGEAILLANPDSIIIIPQLKPLMNCDVTSRATNLIIEIISAVVQNKSLCPSGTVSLASACISAGFCLIAAATTPHVHSILTIGTYANASNILQHTLSQKGQGDSRYTVNAFLASFWKPVDENLRRLCIAYCSDDHYRIRDSEQSQLRKLLPLDKKAADLFKRLHEDTEFLETSLINLYNSHEQEFVDISPVHFVSKLRCKNIVLLHALKDDIIPPNESLLLYSSLKSRPDIASSLFITSVLNHGDRKDLTWLDVLQTVNLIGVLAVFFPPHRKVAVRCVGAT